MMLRSNLEHLIIGLILQTIIGILTGNWWWGAAIVIGLFAGTELAQSRFRDIRMPNEYTWAYNVFLPTTVVLAIAAAVQYI